MNYQLGFFQNLAHLSVTSSILAQQGEEGIPVGFPIAEWSDQSTRYTRYWQFFTGEVLLDVRDMTEDRVPIYTYPLKVNMVYDTAIRNASIILGEELFESYRSPILTKTVAKENLLGEKPSDDEAKLAKMIENAINTVWSDSNGKSEQTNGVIMSQFLGGFAVQVSWTPWADTATLPITVKVLPPDFIYPVFRNDNYFRLNECWVAYRMPYATAAATFDLDETGIANGMVMYSEHWTETEYSIYINNQPAKGKDGTVYRKQVNPFGVVPIVYIPNMRAGNLFGHSVVDAIDGIQYEYNALLRNQSDYMLLALNPLYFGKDITTSNMTPKMIDSMRAFIDLGKTSSANGKEPSVWAEGLPTLPEWVANHSDSVFEQGLRSAAQSSIAYGEEEGSQRTALTLAFKLLPTILFTRLRRNFLAEGMNRVAYIIGQMLYVKQKVIGSGVLPITIPQGWQKKIQIYQQFLPAIPRDREQMVNEILLRYGANLSSMEKAISDFGDIQDVQAEIELILEQSKERMEMEAKQQQMAKTPPKSASVEDKPTDG